TRKFLLYKINRYPAVGNPGSDPSIGLQYIGQLTRPPNKSISFPYPPVGQSHIIERPGTRQGKIIRILYIIAHKTHILHPWKQSPQIFQIYPALWDLNIDPDFIFELTQF